MILAYFLEHDRIPSTNDICTQAGMHKTAVAYAYRSLAIAGYIEKDGSRYRFSRAWEGRPSITIQKEASQ